MALLDSSLWSGGSGSASQNMQGAGYANPMMGPQGGGQVPQLPPSLAQRMIQQAQARMSPQSNPMLSMVQPPPMAQQMPPFQPSMMSKPPDFWQSQFQPNQGQIMASTQGSIPKDGGIGLPGQLPQNGGPQIPDNMQGMGLGANAPQMMGGPPPGPPGMPPGGAGGMNPLSGPGANPSLEDLKSQMFNAYTNLYPQGNI